MSEQNEINIEKTFDPKEVEKGWYDKWEKGGYFKPQEGKTKKSYCIIMPPPNVTGRLHSGHALDITTQDTIIRFKRMKGFKTLFLPGMDHAGIATQAVVEKLVYQKEGKKRSDFKREEFVEKIWEWKKKYGDAINKQVRCIGTSCDWDYFIFTLDKEANEAVRKVFVDLYNEGLIYQSDYIINWDPVLQSAISDAEVEHKEVQGAFYNILYKLKDSDQTLEIATTRPETLLGDTAVAVNPNDPRFKDLIGKKVIVPICNREVPIIPDEHVDIEVGTGCLKVTPGHDFNDFEIGRRHNLEIVNILNKDGTLNNVAGEFEGLSSKKARPKVVEKLKELGLFVKEESHVHQVGHGDRSKAMIEPKVSKQWFLNVQEMAADAVKAVEEDKVRFYPKNWENTYFSWLREPRNWCISRQLWWGHQIPVFYCNTCGKSWAAESTPQNCQECNSTSIYQDPDVLDTWFSSGLWPFSTLGWPNKERMKKKDFNSFFPNSTLVTGFDIIFFWVARMMMMSSKVMNGIPFEKIYIHALIKDKLGRKVSKSLGNGVDPLEMVDQYGADALRFTLAAGSGYNRGLNLDPEKIVGYKNFINKVWNAFRFIYPFLEEADAKLPEVSSLDHHERWILSELNSVSKKMNHSLEEFRFDDASSSIYSFVYDKFCSWFIEISKNVLHGEDTESKKRRASVLKYSFKKISALLHPITPFITEEFWKHLKEDNEDLLIIQDYPEFDEKLDFSKDQEMMNKFVEVVTNIRNLRASVNIKPKDEIKLELFCDDKDLSKYFENNKVNFYNLAKVKDLSVKDKSSKRPNKSIMAATTFLEIFVPLDGVIDLSQQIKRLEKELLKAEKEHGGMNKKLTNEKFLQKAKKEVVEEVKQKANDLEEKIASIKKNLKGFK